MAEVLGSLILGYQRLHLFSVSHYLKFGVCFICFELILHLCLITIHSWSIPSPGMGKHGNGSVDINETSIHTVSITISSYLRKIYPKD